MATEKTTYNEWDKPIFPSNNLDVELDNLIDDIDADVGSASVSSDTTEIIDKPDDLNFGHDLEVFDDADGTVTINSTAVSPDEVGVADGVAELDSNKKIPSSQLPSIAITETDVVADKSERLALDAETGDVAIQEDENQSYILKGTDPSVDSEWSILESPTSGVSSVFGRSGSITAESGDYDHSQISNISSNDHHDRYSNSEAVSAVNGETTLSVDISGDADTLDGKHAEDIGLGADNFEIVENTSTNSLDFNYTG